MNTKALFTVLAAVTLLLSPGSASAGGQADRGNAREVVGAVYTMTNSPTGNEVVVFDRDGEGLLTLAGALSTGGLGFGGGLDPLGSQGSLTLSADHRWLVAVNAGSNDISVFRVSPRGLVLADKVDSGGVFPVSVTLFHDLVYVLNAGTSPNITGFFLSHTGRLVPLPDSTRYLGSGAFAQVGFDPQGEKLVVTDKTGNRILVFSVQGDGSPNGTPTSTASEGLVPFAFLFDERGHLLVTEAGSGAVSSYRILEGGTLEVISPSVANGQVATCWIVANERGDVFATNPGSDSLSTYKLRIGDGQLTLREATAGAADKPLGAAISVNGRFLYALAPGNGTVHSFRIEGNGGLTDLGAVPGGLSIFAQGLAAR